MAPLIVYGTRTCSDCIRTRMWLREHGIAYTEIHIEDDEKYAEEVLRLTNGETRTPVVVFPDGSFLAEPTNEELATKITHYS